MNTSLPEEEKNLPETKKAHHSEAPLPEPTPSRKWYHRWRDIPRGVIITSLIALIILVSVIAYYEYRLEGKYRSSYHDMPRMYTYAIDPWDDWDMYGWHDRKWRDHWEDFDRRMEMMERRHQAMMESLERVPTTPIAGRYSGTRIIDGDTLTYSLDISSGSVSGTYSGTNSGTLTPLEQALKGLGYTVEKKESGYTFSGKTENIEKVIDLFR